jgi:ribosomal-protein-alanine N-acetyltransferase
MILPTPTGRGPRVRLALPRRADKDEVIALNSASRSFHRPWASPPTTPAQFARQLARSRRPDVAVFFIRRVADDALLGGIEISQIVRGSFQSAYLGYQIGAAWSQQGFMTEAVGLALTYAFRRVGLHRLEANIQPENTPSIALVSRLGFTREGYSRRYLKIGGRWRDHERWAILAEDWHVRRPGRRLTPGAPAV